LKPSIVAPLLLILFIVFSASAAAAGSYDNGPPNGDINGWLISTGFAVSETFVLLQTQQVDSFSFSLWLTPGQGNVITSAELSITSQENGGTVYFDQVLTSWFQTGSCVLNEFGYNQCTDTVNFAGPVVTGGTTYWINISNAIGQDVIGWDENDGVGCGGDNGLGGGCPSLASENMVGTIPSEAFTINGGPVGSVPEPGSIGLFGSGILGLAGVLRRKLF
jgi:hypothetical protein